MSINIKPENKGKFTAYKKRTGKTTEEALHSKDPHVRQMANFAKNAKKWKHKDGGTIKLKQGGGVPSQDIHTGQYFDTRLGLDNNNVITPLPTEGIDGPGPKDQPPKRQPIFVTNPNDPRLKAYNDSLTVYNSKLAADKFLATNPSMEQWVNFVKKDSPELNNAWNRLSKLNKTNPKPVIDRDVKLKSSVTGNVETGSQFIYKKPVQPVVYQKPQPKLDKYGKKIVEGTQKDFDRYYAQSPLVLESDGIYRGDMMPAFRLIKDKPKSVEQPEKIFPAPVVGQSRPAQITSPNPYTEPQPQGQYVFGPANSVIGVRDDNGKFTPVNMPEQRGKVNQADLELLNNQEAMKKYVEQKGLKYKDGGKVKGKKANWGASLGTDPYIGGPGPAFQTNVNPGLAWGQPIPLEKGQPAPTQTLMKGTAPYSDFMWNTPTITGANTPLMQDPNSKNTPLMPGWSDPNMPAGGYLNNNKAQIYPGSGGIQPYNPPVDMKRMPPPEGIQPITAQSQMTPKANTSQMNTTPKGPGTSAGDMKLPTTSKTLEGSAGDLALTGLMVADMFAGKDKIRRRYLRPEDLQTENAHPYGTGSQALSKYGATIKGKKAQKAFWGALIGAVSGGGGAAAAGGTQAAAAATAGKAATSSGTWSQLAGQAQQQGGNKMQQDSRNAVNGIQDALAPLMMINKKADAEADRLNQLYLNGQVQNVNNLYGQQKPVPQNYMNFGGTAPGIMGSYYGRTQQFENGGTLQTHNGGQTELKSYNHFDGGTMQFNGASHENGGIDISYNHTPVEVEGQETAFKDQNGDLKIMGNLKVPGTNMKYKDLSKKLADKENKAQKYIDKGTSLLNIANPSDPFERLSFNSGQAMMQGGLAKQKQIAELKQHLGDMQEAHLELINEQSPKAYNGKTIYADGGTVGDPITEAAIKAAAEKYGVSFEHMKKLITLESNFSPSFVSNRGAQGVMQFMPQTAKKYGVDKILLSKDPKDQARVIDAGVHHFKELLDQNNGDYTLASAAYNGGQKAVDFVKNRTNNPNITGEDWTSFMENRNKTAPTKKQHAWQHETLNYVKALNSPNIEQVAPQFRDEYYNAPNKLTTPLTSTDFNFTPKSLTPSQQPNVSTIPQTDYGFNFINPSAKRKPSNVEGIAPSQFLGEAYAMATNQQEPVKAQLYQPDLFTPYQVSFQDRINENNATFNGIQKQLAYDPSALSTLAGQQYQANSQVLGEEFRTNQGIANDIINKNVSLINEAKKTNLGILDQQYVRQSQAKSNTKSINQDALNSISSKILQKQASNNALKVYENLYPDYAFNRNGQAQYYGPNAAQQIDWSGTMGTPDQPRTTIATKNGNQTTTQYFDDPTKTMYDRLKLEKAKRDDIKDQLTPINSKDYLNTGKLAKKFNLR